MGTLFKTTCCCFLFLVLMVARALAATPETAPPDFPPPPPLPPEVRDKAPLEPPPDLPDPSELYDQLRQLEELLSMAPDKLSRLRQTIEFIEKMSSEEREAMRIRLSQITRMTPELKAEIQDLSALLPSASRSGLSQFWLAASPRERSQVRASLEPLPPEQKAELLEARIQAFVQRRDEVFAKMKDSLDQKRKHLKGTESPPE